MEAGSPIICASPEPVSDNFTWTTFLPEVASKIGLDTKIHASCEIRHSSTAETASKRNPEAPRKMVGLTSEAPTTTAENGFEVTPKLDVDNRQGTQTPTIPPVAVNGDCNSNFTISPVPLTNGHQEKKIPMPSESAHFDDIWSPATRLKRRLEDTKDLIVCPGVFDGFSARIAISVGFDAMYMVGITFSTVYPMIETSMETNNSVDWCWDHGLKVGYGRLRRSQPYRDEGACRYDSEFGF